MLAEEPDEFDSHIFLNYLFNMHLMCLQMDKELTYECAHRNMRNLEIPIERVDECVSNSFETPNNWESYNVLLAEDRDVANNLGVAMSPSISINGLMYHDELRAENIFGQICKSYHINLMPEVCKADFDIQTVLGNFNDDFVPPRDGFPYGHFLFMVFVVLVFNVCCFVYCQKKKKR